MRPNYLRPRDRDNHKESAACPSIKASNSSHFHIPLIFFLYFPSHAVSEILFSLFDTFPHLRNLKKKKKKRVQHRVTTQQGQLHVSSAKQRQALLGEVSTWMGNQIRLPRVV